MTDTARMLADTTARLLDRAMDATGTAEAALLERFRDAGLALTLVPEAAGGMGCSLAEAAIVARLWGARAAPLPIVALLLAPRCAADIGGQIEADTATVAFSGDMREGLGSTPATIEAPWFPGCTSVLAGGGIQPAGNAERFETIAGEVWLRLHRDTSSPAVEATRAQESDAAGALLTCAAMLGAMDHTVALALDYAGTRQQFGRPIGKFQAVQHMIADAASEKMVSEAALAAALTAFDAGALRRVKMLAVKAQCGRAASTIAAIAHQLFGAIGFTQEHELQRYTRRLWAWRDDWGRQQDCEAEVGFAALAAGADGLWPLIADAC